MAINIVNGPGFESPIEKAFAMKMLSTPTPNMIHNIPAIRKKMPKRSGQTLRMERYHSLGTAKVPLGRSGATPPGKSLQTTFVDVTPSWFGTYVEINQQVTLTYQDPVLNNATLRLGVCLRQTQDELMRDLLAGAAPFINCTAAGGDVPSIITQSDADEVVSLLLDNNAMMILDSIEAQNKYDTAPIRDAFFALCSTKLTKTLNAIPEFINKNKYASSSSSLRSEWGALGNLRFLVSSIGSVETALSMNGKAIYNIFVVGMEAIGCVEQDGASARFIYRPPIYSGPLAQNSSAGFLFAEAPVILNSTWVYRLRTTAL